MKNNKLTLISHVLQIVMTALAVFLLILCILRIQGIVRNIPVDALFSVYTMAYVAYVCVRKLVLIRKNREQFSKGRLALLITVCFGIPVAILAVGYVSFLAGYTGEVNVSIVETIAIVYCCILLFSGIGLGKQEET